MQFTEITSLISNQLNIDNQKISNVLNLFAEGATIPFIARYRKEITGGLEDFQIFEIQKQQQLYLEIAKRKSYILETLASKNIRNSNLTTLITNCWNKTELEDYFAPYKSAKKTKASIAKENGLESLAKTIMSQNTPKIELQKYCNTIFPTTATVLEGVTHILIEWITENQFIKNKLRSLYKKEALLVSKKKKEADETHRLYETFFDFKQSITKLPSHRILAILRGVEENVLSVSITIPKEKALAILENQFVKNNHTTSNWVKDAVKIAYQKKISPSLENEFLKTLKTKADTTSIQIFSKNLEQLLLTPPIKPTNVLAIDPGFRTGCKIACINQNGDLLAHSVIFPHEPQNQIQESIQILENLIQQYELKTIAIGNGTAGRETENFVKKHLNTKQVAIFLVNESGASVYSASEIGREEFPNHDITIRGAVSIGRRLLDPLAELVKIDPKSIGVGQYQHDVDQTMLKNELNFTVSKCVNNVGVQLNTASKYLLENVAGIGPVLAQNIVKYRSEKGDFKNLKELKNVPKLGTKAFEQCAGFLRIQGDEPLDNTGIHPEKYALVSKIAKEQNCSVTDLIGNKELLKTTLSENLQNEIGKYTLTDIINALAKPNIDPRTAQSQITFKNHIQKIEDLFIGMIIEGQINNLTNFGAFVNLGIKENGLLHISEISDKFISDPSEVLQLNQIVKVKIKDIDLNRKKISLSLKY